MQDCQSLSIVVPVYRGEPYLEQLVTEIADLRETLAQSDAPIALDRAIFVDDAAIDGSAALLDQLARSRPWMEVLHLPRNGGQHAATAAGFARSRGAWVATLDEDLQHRPRHLLELLAAATEGSADLAYAEPRGAVHRTLYRDLSSRAAKRWIGLLSGNSNVRHINSFRLVRGPIARAAAGSFRPGTYLDIALFWHTQRVVAVPVELVDRRDLSGGGSGYTFLSLVGHARRMIASSWSGPPRRAGESTATQGERAAADRIALANEVDRRGDRALRDFLAALPRPGGGSTGGAC